MNLYQVEIEIFRGIPDEMVFVSAKDLSEAIKKTLCNRFFGDETKIRVKKVEEQYIY